MDEDLQMTSSVEHHDDLELVRLARGGDDRALDDLLARYRMYARAKARSYFLAGSDREDVVQEGMIGLYKAIRDYDLDQQTPFKAFAELCISRQILTAIKTANRNKHIPLNTSLSLDAPTPGAQHDRPLGENLLEPRAGSDPEQLIISSEEIDALRSSLRENLSDLEGNVLRLYMSGKSYEEIANTLGNHVKSIDNALQRIKRKLQEHLTRRDDYLTPGW